MNGRLWTIVALLTLLSAMLPRVAAADQTDARLDGLFETLRTSQDAQELRATEAEIWDRDPAAGPDLCDVVLVAQLLGYIGKGRPAGVPRLADVPAVAKVAGGRLCADTCQEVLAASETTITEVHRMLTG